MARFVLCGKNMWHCFDILDYSQNWNYLHNVPRAKTIFHSGWLVSLVLEIYWIVNSTFMFSSKKRATLLNLFAQINLHDKAWDRKTLKSMFNVIASTENINQFSNPNQSFSLFFGESLFGTETLMDQLYCERKLSFWFSEITLHVILGFGIPKARISFLQSTIALEGQNIFIKGCIDAGVRKDHPSGKGFQSWTKKFHKHTYLSSTPAVKEKLSPSKLLLVHPVNVHPLRTPTMSASFLGTKFPANENLQTCISSRRTSSWAFFELHLSQRVPSFQRNKLSCVA